MQIGIREGKFSKENVFDRLDLGDLSNPHPPKPALERKDNYFLEMEEALCYQ